MERPSRVLGPQNDVEKIGNLRVGSLRTPLELFFRLRRRVPLRNQLQFVGRRQGSDAGFLLNQGNSDFALLDLSDVSRVIFLFFLHLN